MTKRVIITKNQAEMLRALGNNVQRTATDLLLAKSVMQAAHAVHETAQQSFNSAATCTALDGKYEDGVEPIEQGDAVGRTEVIEENGAFILVIHPPSQTVTEFRSTKTGTDD